jgi:hypothetical protein
MIYEYAEEDFAGRKAIVAGMGITDNDITRLRNSANNLAPTEGGRHAKRTSTAEWDLDEQKAFIATFLKRWIECRVRAGA